MQKSEKIFGLLAMQKSCQGTRSHLRLKNGALVTFDRWSCLCIAYDAGRDSRHLLGILPCFGATIKTAFLIVFAYCHLFDQKCDLDLVFIGGIGYSYHIAAARLVRGGVKPTGASPLLFNSLDRLAA